MRIIDELTNQEIESPDLEAGKLSEPVMWASPEAYMTIDNVEKFALADDDFDEVQIYHAWTAEELAQRESDEQQSQEAAQRDALMESLASLYSEELAASDKVGELFKIVRIGDVEVRREYVPDPNYDPDAPDGTYLKPFVFVAPMEVEVGKFYTDGEDIWECVQAGNAESFTAPWFDVIA